VAGDLLEDLVTCRIELACPALSIQRQLKCAGFSIYLTAERTSQETRHHGEAGSNPQRPTDFAGIVPRRRGGKAGLVNGLR
jgi:hypothetical protein